MNYSSTCRCEAVQIQVSLPENLEEYEPRACDCDFCVARSASYISDPDGYLIIHHTDELIQLRQGDEHASFWQCSSCKDLVAVTCEFKTQIKGAINASLLGRQYKLKQPVSASPKLLTPEEKLDRWNSIWSQVELRDELSL